jgi:hypothetical protein
MSRTPDLHWRFTYHPPDQQAVRQHELIRDTLEKCANVLDEALPDGREKSLAITKMEEAMFWANAGIARYRPNG